MSSPGLRRTDGVVFPFPAPTGAAALAGSIAALVTTTSQSIAIAALLALLMMAALDFLLSALALGNRPVSVHPVRRFAASPQQRTTFSGAVDPGGFDIRVVVRRLSRSSRDSEFAVVDPITSSFPLELAASTRKATVIRHRTECSVFGLIWARRYVTQEIHPVHVAPGADGEANLDLDEDEDITRIREYVPGDRIGRISWPTTARTGRLHVRTETPSEPEISVVVDLGADVLGRESTAVDARLVGEVTLVRAATVVTDLLGRGRTIRLWTNALRDSYFQSEANAALENPSLRPRVGVTYDADGRPLLDGVSATTVVNGPVTDELELIRRLSVAEHGPAMPTPAPPYILVDSEGVRWIR